VVASLGWPSAVDGQLCVLAASPEQGGSSSGWSGRGERCDPGFSTGSVLLSALTPHRRGRLGQRRWLGEARGEIDRLQLALTGEALATRWASLRKGPGAVAAAAAGRWGSPLGCRRHTGVDNWTPRSPSAGSPLRRPEFSAHGGSREPPQIEAHHDVVLAQTMTRWLGLSTHLEPMPRVQVDRALVDAYNLESQSAGALKRRPVSNRGHESVSEAGSSMARRYPDTSQFSFVGRCRVNAAREADRNLRIEGGEPRIASQPGPPRCQRKSALTHHR